MSYAATISNNGYVIGSLSVPDKCTLNRVGLEIKGHIARVQISTLAGNEWAYPIETTFPAKFSLQLIKVELCL